MDKPKLILTGSGGRIGSILSRNLADRFKIYGIDKSPETGDNTFRVDISDPVGLREAFKSIGKATYLIHLAASSDEKSGWEPVLKNNIIGTKNVYECARKQKLRRVIFASSNHVTGGYEEVHPKLHLKNDPEVISVHDPIRPDGDYGTSKAFGEALARQYYELYDLQSICLRIGTVLSDDDPIKDHTKRSLKTWLSHRDLVQLVGKSLTAPVEFGIYYGVSNNRGRFWDLSKAEQELGYRPEDDASQLI